MFLLQAFHQERRTLTLSEARRALTFESKCERSSLVNGTVHEKKGDEKVNTSKSDAANNEAKDLPCVIVPQKPVIIVCQASIDEKQEECSQIATIPKGKDLILEEAVDDSLECQEDCNKENINSCGKRNMQTIDKNNKYVTESETKCETKIQENKILNNEISSIIKHEFPRNGTLNTSCDSDKVFCNHYDTDTKATTDSCSETSINCEKNMDTLKLKELTPVKNTDVTVTNKPRDNSHSKTRDCGGKVQKLKDAETRSQDAGDMHQSSTDSTQGKSPSQKPVPTVYMNKVRMSFMFLWSNKASWWSKETYSR